MDRNQSLEGLDFVGKNGLPISSWYQPLVLCMHLNLSFSPGSTSPTLPPGVDRTHTFMPAQKAADDLWSHV